MGLLKPEDWSAQWITASKWFMPPEMRPPGLIIRAEGWADVDLGAIVNIDAIKLVFANPNAIPKRFKIEAADEPQFIRPRLLVDRTAEDYRMLGNGAQVFPLNDIAARHIRLRIIGASAKEKAVVRQMQVMSNGRNVALMRPTREMGTNWANGHAVFMVDGMPSIDDGNQVLPDACPTTAAPLLRKIFMLQKKIQRATLRVAALGMADVTVNGQPVTDAVLGPAFTDYTKRVVYLTHDISNLLVNGENVLGVTLGNGFFNRDFPLALSF